MARIPTLLSSGNVGTGRRPPSMGFGVAAAIDRAGDSIGAGLNRLGEGFADQHSANVRRDAEAAAKAKQRKQYDDHIWSEQRLTEAQRKWAQWTQDVQKNGSEDVVEQFNKGFEEYRNEVLKIAPNPEARDLLSMKLDDLGTTVFKSSLVIEAGNRSQNTINAFSKMIADSSDLIATVPETYSLKQEELKKSLGLAVSTKRISPEVALKIEGHIENLAAQAAEALIPTNPMRAKEIIEGAKGIEWTRKRAILNDINRAIQTNDTLQHYNQVELAKSNFQSIMQTGKAIDGFSVEKYASTFPKDRQAAAMAEANSQIKIAQNVFVASSEMRGKSAQQIMQVLAARKPQPGSASFADEAEVYRHLTNVADSQIKLLQQDPFTYSRQDPIVDGAWKQVEDLPDDATPAVKAAAFNQAMTASVEFQRSLGIPEGRISVMSQDQARSSAMKINQGNMQEVQQTLAAMAQSFGSFYPMAFRDMMRLPEGQRIDGSAQVVALHFGKPFLSDFMQAMRTPESDFKLDPGDRRALSESLTTDANLLGFSSAILSGNPGGFSYVDDFRRSIDKYAMSLLARGRASSPSEAVKKASDLIIGSAYQFTEVNGVSVAVKLTQGDIQLSEDDVDSIGGMLKHLPREVKPESIDTTRFAFPPNITDEVKMRSIRDTLRSDTFWVTNSTNDGVTLFMNGMDGSTAPVMTRDGKQVEYKFMDLISMAAMRRQQIESQSTIFRKADYR